MKTKYRIPKGYLFPFLLTLPFYFSVVLIILNIQLKPSKTKNKFWGRADNILFCFDLCIQDIYLHMLHLPAEISVNIFFPFLFFCSCWDTTEHNVPWWVIRSPILISIIVSKQYIETWIIHSFLQCICSLLFSANCKWTNTPF